MDTATEQRALGERCWQLVGLTDDLAADDAWVRLPLFGKDVFVQRFGDELRGFHNICAHRGFPLRREDAGHGRVTCGFHGWGYSRDGIPTHVPRNAELFGLSREQREALALPRVRVETIGRFVFACLDAAAPSLAAYLGPYADVFGTCAAHLGDVIYRDSAIAAASWRLHAEISLDDYHLAAIHASTFGAGDDRPLHSFVYRRDGIHSAYLRRRDATWSFDGFWADMSAGILDRSGYKIFNCFPHALLVITADACIATSVFALDEDRCRIDNRVIAWRGGPTDPAIGAYFATVFREDREACERWRHAAAPVLGKLEERVGWFRDALASFVPPSR